MRITFPPPQFSLFSKDFQTFQTFHNFKPTILGILLKYISWTANIPDPFSFAKTQCVSAVFLGIYSKGTCCIVLVIQALATGERIGSDCNILFLPLFSVNHYHALTFIPVCACSPRTGAPCFILSPTSGCSQVLLPVMLFFPLLFTFCSHT